MKRLIVPAFMVAVFASSVSAQRVPKTGGIPPGFWPPAGMCRVWIDGVSPGHQSAPTDCTTAVRNRPANGRVIFGNERPNNGRKDADRRDDRDDDDKDAVKQRRDREKDAAKAQREREKDARKAAEKAEKDRKKELEKARERERDREVEKDDKDDDDREKKQKAKKVKKQKPKDSDDGKKPDGN